MPNDATELLRRARLRPASARCLHPDCTNLCQFRPEIRGKKPLFCSAQCANDHSTQRRQLLAEIESLETAYRQVSEHSKTGRQLALQIKQTDWHLARFGGRNKEIRTA